MVVDKKVFEDKPEFTSLEELLIDYSNSFLDMMFGNEIDSGKLADCYTKNNKLKNEN